MKLEAGKTYVFKNEECKDEYIRFPINHQYYKKFYKDGFTLERITHGGAGIIKGVVVITIDFEEIKLFKEKETKKEIKTYIGNVRDWTGLKLGDVLVSVKNKNAKIIWCGDVVCLANKGGLIYGNLLSDFVLESEYEDYIKSKPLELEVNKQYKTKKNGTIELIHHSEISGWVVKYSDGSVHIHPDYHLRSMITE